MSPGPVTTARATLADDIRAALTTQDTQDVHVHTTMPDRVKPPCVILTEGTPLATTDQTFGALTLTFEAAVIAAPTTAAAAVERLDALTDALIQGLWADYQPTVTAYTTLTGPDTQPYLTARIDLTTSITI